MTYLRNCWYMAAWADDLPESGGLARTLLEEPVFIFRDKDGQPRALFDRCPHRFAPLSRGWVEDGAAVCGYHGLAFDGSGACVRNPHGPILRTLDVRAYALVEAYRALWIWMGEATLADPALIPDLAYLTQVPETAYNHGYLNGHGHYQLYVDNILDLTHADYLHPTTLGGGMITRTRPKITEAADGSIAIHWHVYDDQATPLFARFLNGDTGRVDSWTEVDWHAPGVLKLVSGAVEAKGARTAGLNVNNVHILTPETAQTCHYFFASTRNFGLEDADLNESIRSTRASIFATEDEPMITAQQERIGTRDFWSLRPALLRTDEAAVKVRRRMDAMIGAEAERMAL